MNFSKANTPGMSLVLVPASSCYFDIVIVLALVVAVTSLSAVVSAWLGPATVSQPTWTALVFHRILSLQVNSKVYLQWCSGSSRRPFSLCPNSQLLLAVPILFQCFSGSRLLSSCLLSSHFCQCFIKLLRPDPNAEGNHWLLQALNQIFPLLKKMQSCRKGWIQKLSRASLVLLVWFLKGKYQIKA